MHPRLSAVDGALLAETRDTACKMKITVALSVVPFPFLSPHFPTASSFHYSHKWEATSVTCHVQSSKPPSLHA